MRSNQSQEVHRFSILNAVNSDITARKPKAMPAAKLPPTPRPSKSPVSSPFSSPLTDLSDLVSLPDVDCIVAEAPPTPVSPTKRRIAPSTSFELKARGPMKKTKSFNDHPTPIQTGQLPLPGGGNLFTRAVNEEWPEFDIDSSDPFLSPSPSKPARAFTRSRTMGSMPLNGHTLFGPSRISVLMMDKENLDPGLGGRRVIDISTTSVG
jgi:hypothetical protein